MTDELERTLDTPGAGTPMSQAASSSGVFTTAPFSVKLGNGGRGNGCGSIQVLVDGQVRWQDSKNCVPRHTGWFYRATFVVDFISGAVSDVHVSGCGVPTACMN